MKREGWCWWNRRVDVGGIVEDGKLKSKGKREGAVEGAKVRRFNRQLRKDYRDVPREIVDEVSLKGETLMKVNCFDGVYTHHFIELRKEISEMAYRQELHQRSLRT